MNDLERRYCLSYQEQLSCGFEEYNERINKILDYDNPDETFKIMTLNDILLSTGIGGDILIREAQAQQESFRDRLIMVIRSMTTSQKTMTRMGNMTFETLPLMNIRASSKLITMIKTGSSVQKNRVTRLGPVEGGQ